jgi:hypothetical protein
VEERRDQVQPPREVALPRKLLIWLTWGTAGTLLFPIIYVIEGLRRPEYDSLHQAISALSLGPGGWVQQINFAICGVSVLWSAYTWRRILAGGVCATSYPIIRGLEGFGLVMIGIFSQDPAYGYPPGSPSGATSPTLAGLVHLAFTIVVVNAMCIGLLIIARRFRGSRTWRGWSTYSIVSAALTMVFMTFFGVAQNTHAVMSGYAGLFERLATNTDTVWSVVIVTQLWIRRPLGV